MPRFGAWATERDGEQGFQTPTSGDAPNGLPYFTWDQGALQLNRDGASWAVTPGTPVTVTYAFRVSGAAPANTGVTGFQPFNSIQIAVAEQMLTRWAEVANITFVRAEDGHTNNATILFGNFVNGPPQFSAFAYLPDPSGMDSSLANGDVWVNISRDYDANPAALPLGAQILLHEIGHTLGLLHPSVYDGGAQSGVTYNADADFWQDTRQFTVQSYFNETFTGASYGEYYVTAPQMFDIAAAQYLYGPNMTTRTGDTIYGFHSNTGIAAFSIGSTTQGAIFCIWDAGGVDTIDVSGYSTPSEIDLRPESFSSAGVHSSGLMIGNISIARGVTIENAIGGSGVDTFIGNDVANVLTGNGDNDIINGAGGIDTSRYALASSSATWYRNANGTWTVTGEGIDTLTSVEFLDFTDRDVFLDRACSTFSGDGTSDVLFHGANGAVVSWSVQGTSLQSGSYIASVVPADWTALGIGDFNGDGRDDVVWRHSTGKVVSWQMNGAAVGSVQSLASLGAEWSFLAVADLNGDLRDDILWRNASNGLVYSWETNASGALATGGGIANLGAEWNLEGIGDFDSDGRDDFLWRNTTSKQTVIWDMDGRTIAAGASTSAQVGAEWNVQGIGDFNGDGRDDILWMNTGGAVVVWHMNGATLLGGGYVASVDPNVWSIVNIGDYNGDGRDDILWQNSSGTVFDWIMSGTTITSAGALATIAPGQWDIIGRG